MLRAELGRDGAPSGYLAVSPNIVGFEDRKHPVHLVLHQRRVLGSRELWDLIKTSEEITLRGDDSSVCATLFRIPWFRHADTLYRFRLESRAQFLGEVMIKVSEMLDRPEAVFSVCSFDIVGIDGERIAGLQLRVERGEPDYVFPPRHFGCVMPSPMHVVHFTLAARSLERMDWLGLGRSDPFLLIYRRLNTVWIPFYRSEVIKRNLDPMWQAFTLPQWMICGKDHKRPLLVQVWDHNGPSNKHNDLIGSVVLTLADLLAARPDHEVMLTDNKKSKRGFLVIKQCAIQVRKPPSPPIPRYANPFPFNEYLAAGFQCRPLIGIDVGAPNGPDAPGLADLEVITELSTEFLRAMQQLSHTRSVSVFLTGATATGADVPPALTPAGAVCSDAADVASVLDASLAVAEPEPVSSIAPLLTAASRRAGTAHMAQAQQLDVLLVLTRGVPGDDEVREAADAMAAAGHLPLAVLNIGLASSRQQRTALRALVPSAAALVSPSTGTTAALRNVEVEMRDDHPDAGAAQLIDALIQQVPRIFLAYVALHQIPPRRDRSADVAAATVAVPLSVPRAASSIPVASPGVPAMSPGMQPADIDGNGSGSGGSGIGGGHGDGHDNTGIRSGLRRASSTVSIGTTTLTGVGIAPLLLEHYWDDIFGDDPPMPDTTLPANLYLPPYEPLPSYDIPAYQLSEDDDDGAGEDSTAAERWAEPADESATPVAADVDSNDDSAATAVSPVPDGRPSSSVAAGLAVGASALRSFGRKATPIVSDAVRKVGHTLRDAASTSPKSSDALFAEAEGLMQSQQHVRAAAKFRAAADAAAREAAPAARRRLFLRRAAEALYSAKAYREAVTACEDALATRDPGDEDLGEDEIALRRQAADALYADSCYTDALSCYRQLFALVEQRHGSSSRQAYSVLTSIGVTMYAMKSYSEAIPVWKRALGLATSLWDTPTSHEWRCRQDLGWALYGSEYFDAAVEQWVAAERIAAMLNDQSRLDQTTRALQQGRQALQLLHGAGGGADSDDSHAVGNNQPYAAQVQRLQSMGFTDPSRLQSVLASVDGSVEQAVNALLSS